MTLRTKIVALLALLAALATVSIGVVSYRTSARELARTVDRSLDEAAERIIDRLPGSGELGRRGRDRPLRFEQISWQVIDDTGDIVAASSDDLLPVAAIDEAVADGERRDARHDVRVDGERFRVLTVPFLGGAVMLGRSLAESDTVAEAILRRTLGAVILVVVATLVAGWLLARQTLRRLEDLTDTAATVASTGRLDVPVPVDGTDETGRLGRAFSGMLDALRRSRDAQQQLVQDAGHELRTPLTSLRTNIAVLRKGIDTLEPAERERLLTDLDSETRELTDLVNELVELATARRDDEPLQRVELDDVVRRAVERTRRRTGRTIEVHTDTPPGRSSLDGRPAALERAVQNLLDNACKFAPDGSIEVRVADGTITVRDHGPGIAPADLPHVFDRFYRATATRGLPGSGLGLAIVRSVAEAHGGTVFARAADGGGAELGFTVPVD